MTFKIALILAFGTQLLAAALALRLNFRYRIYSAWFFVSAALCVGAILRLTTLAENWMDPPRVDENWVQYASAFVSLLASILLLAGMSFIEPFFEQMAKAQENLRKEHNRLESIVSETEEDLRLAQRIQQRLLPDEVPQLPQLDVFGQSDAAEWTSGDYFDFLNLGDGSTAMIVADVSGHGLGPALLMSSIRASFRGLASTTGDLQELMTQANRAVKDAVSDTEFVTAMVVKYDLQQQVLHYAGAGHPAYLMDDRGEWDVLTCDSPPLGIVQDLTVESETKSPIEPGAILVVVTDGILETENTAGERFGEQGLMHTVKHCRQQSAERIVKELIGASRKFSDERAQQDDITALVVKFTE